MTVIAVVIYDNMWAFDYGVAVEIWGIDRTDAGVPGFEFRRCSVDGRPVEGHAGMTLGATHDLGGLASADVILAPGRDHHTVHLGDEVGSALRAAHQRGATIVGMCGGAFTLAQAGLLEGRRATTHWLLADDLRRLYPDVIVEQEDLYVEDDGIWTSAGTASLIDLCLQLIRSRHGATVASTIARRMVTPPHRAGNQRPYIDSQWAPTDSSATDPIQTVMAWAVENLHARQPTSELARMSHMSDRTFVRQFAKATGTAPQKWLLHQRLLAVQNLLETTNLTVQAIAERTGLGSALLLRRHFTAYFDATPREYRRQFRGKEVMTHFSS